MTPTLLSSPRYRSAFAAAALSVLFPGLGHAYAGAWRRALVWAAVPFLLVAAGLGVLVRLDRYQLAGVLIQGWFLQGVLIGNLVALVYRVAAVVDAWQVTRRLNQRDRGPIGPSAIPRGPGVRYGGGVRNEPATVRSEASGIAAFAGGLSLVGLVAAVLVAAGAHVAIARYDLLATSLANCVFQASGTGSCSSDASGVPGSSAPSDTGLPGISLPPEGSALPGSSSAPWTGTDRLNILLVGIDQRGNQNTFNTDTLIVASIDPTTKRVALFSIPRDTVAVPMPPGPLRAAFGATYGAKINSLFDAVQNRPDLCPGATPVQRGFNCLKSTLGYLYGLDIQYYVEVNFSGFIKVVDALGGVTIDVQSPVIDDKYPTDAYGDQRVYIPTGIQHMSGTQALIYARSRHGSNDFDRGARQQRVITSVLAQTDISKILPNLDALVSAFEQTVRTDVPREIVPQLLQLASQVDTKAIRSFVFAPPLYETEDYVPGVHDFIYPKVALIRSAVRTAFTSDPTFEAERQKIAEEGASVWVLNGSGRRTEAADVASYLDYLGFAATAPTQKVAVIAAPRIVVYNGAEARLSETIARLQTIFGVTVVTQVDPTVHVDIVITIGRSTPDMTPPPLP